MYTSYEYVIVQKIVISEFNRFGQKWRSQRLYFKFLDDKTVYDISIPNKFDILDFKKHDKVKLNLDFYKCGNGVQQLRFKIDGVLLCS